MLTVDLLCATPDDVVLAQTLLDNLVMQNALTDSGLPRAQSYMYRKIPVRYSVEGMANIAVVVFHPLGAVELIRTAPKFVITYLTRLVQWCTANPKRVKPGTRMQVCLVNGKSSVGIGANVLTREIFISWNCPLQEGTILPAG